MEEDRLLDENIFFLPRFYLTMLPSCFQHNYYG